MERLSNPSPGGALDALFRAPSPARPGPPTPECGVESTDVPVDEDEEEDHCGTGTNEAA